MPLTRDQILAADDLPREEVPVPEWGGTVLVRTLTGTERDRFEETVGSGRDRDLGNVRARLCALALCDETGKRLFSHADVEALGGKSAAALARVFDVASRLCGLSKKDVDELEAGLKNGQGA